MKKLLIAALAIIPALSGAIWAVRPENVPLDRLIRNVKASIQRQPKESGNYYVLGRLHSLGFAKGTPQVPMAVPIRTNETQNDPQFLPWESIIVQMEKKPAKLTSKMKGHLMGSLSNYRKASQLDPNSALYRLGLAWMLELGSPYASQTKPLNWNGTSAKNMEGWKKLAFREYRKAYDLTVEGDLQNGMGLGADAAISVEAGKGIIRMLKRDGVTASERSEIQKIEANIQKIESMPRPVTPIIFSLSGGSSLDELLDPAREIKFDLRGFGKAETWPWVRSTTAVLVWDPKGEGKITSGTQLFGSATWWMMWPDGYAPLRALDDDRDGFLTGSELKGLSAWEDRDGNGKSDPGEVRPLQTLGIRWLSTRPDEGGSILSSAKGIGLNDGTVLPTFDWIPTPNRSLSVKNR